MNARATRLAKIETAADQQNGVCVICLKNGVCTKPEFEDTRTCGKSRADLPSLLYPAQGDASETHLDNVQVFLPDNARDGNFNARLMRQAQAAGLDERALEFLKKRFPLPEGDGT